MTAVEFIACEDDFWAVRFAFDQDVLETIRSTVPTDCRQWQRADRAWIIARSTWARVLADALTARGHIVVGLDDPQAGADWAGALLAAAPPEIRPRVVRALARVLHPDAGGDLELMKALNAAADRLGV